MKKLDALFEYRYRYIWWNKIIVEVNLDTMSLHRDSTAVSKVTYRIKWTFFAINFITIAYAGGIE